MSKSITRLEKYKTYRSSIDRMVDPSTALTPKQGTFFFNSENTSWFLTVILGLLATVSIVVLALVMLGATL
jgi:hypothetical protein